MSQVQHKSWLSPFLLVAFAIISTTGILMLFHVRLPDFHVLHQWLGLVFVIAVALHLIMNWRMFVNYLSNKKAAIGLIAAVLLSVFIVSVAPQGQPHGGDGGRDRDRTHQRGSAKIR